jgi:hypothetical protein
MWGRLANLRPISKSACHEVFRLFASGRHRLCGASKAPLSEQCWLSLSLSRIKKAHANARLQAISAPPPVRVGTEHTDRGYIPGWLRLAGRFINKLAYVNASAPLHYGHGSDCRGLLSASNARQPGASVLIRPDVHNKFRRRVLADLRERLQQCLLAHFKPCGRFAQGLLRACVSGIYAVHKRRNLLRAA